MKSTELTLVQGNNAVEVLGDLRVPAHFYNRITLGAPTLDEIFGGSEMPGILPGTSFLFTGQPGAGKSTMCLQLAERFHKSGLNVLYNVGEENKFMVKMRADRLGIEQNFCMAQFADVDSLVKFCVENGVEVLFQDSIQSLRDGDLERNSRLLSVVKKLQVLSKDHRITIFLVGHITKGGIFAGPQEIKHDVDAHAHLSLTEGGARVIELDKNRFGPANVPYEFSLSAQGLDFQQTSLPTAQVREAQGTTRAADRRESVKVAVRDALLRGEGVSGYCFERLKCDCSGGFFRVMVMKACEELKGEGHTIVDRKVNGRTHSFIEKK